MPTVTLDGIRVFYEQRGQGDPVLLIHGLGSSTEDWDMQVEALQRTYTVVTYDVRGHGQSDKPAGPYSVAQFAQDAARLIEHLTLGPVHVIGLSMGGMIAFQLAIDRPDLVRSLVIVNSGPAMILRSWKARLGIMQRRLIVRWMGMRKMGAVLSTRLLPAPEHAALRATFVERWSRNDPRAYLCALNALVGWSVQSLLPTITRPTLVVTADMDYTSVALKHAYAKLMPNARLVVIPDSRHLMPVERPDAFHAELLPFLAMAGAGVGADVGAGHAT